jgi:hypothetical protein
MGFIKRLLGFEPPKGLKGNARERWYLGRNLIRDERIYAERYAAWVDAGHCPCCFEAGNVDMWSLRDKNRRRRHRLAQLDAKLGTQLESLL